MTSYRFIRKLADGSTYHLGTACQYEQGWRFIPNVTAHKSSRKFHPTMGRCIPRWVGYPDRCESFAVVPKPEYPEHDKLTKLNGANQHVGDFLEWLGEQGITLCTRYDGPRGEGAYHDELVPHHRNREELIAAHFGIDRNKLEKEKRVMLEKLRNVNAESA